MKSGRAELLVGLMSGTSADGIDAVLAKISDRGAGLAAKVLAHRHVSFSSGLHRQILEMALHGTVAGLCELNFVLGERFARAALGVIHQSKREPRQIAAIGSHGQTLHHLPNARTPSTLQLGEPAVIAERTGIAVIADFRVRDVAAGGQGAPLVPFADWALFTHPRRPRLVQNIGGIGNLTFLPPQARLEEVLAFDTGPGNMVIDAVVFELSNGRRRFDLGGRWAAQGKASARVLKQMMEHPFLRVRPPKTTGREEFGKPFMERFLADARRARLSPADIVATATAFTVETIAQAYQRFVFPRLTLKERKHLQIVLGGGGAKNTTLRRWLAERLAGPELLTHEDFGISNAAKEALAFAILAYQTLRGRPGNVPSATGARKAVVLGKIIPAG